MNYYNLTDGELLNLIDDRRQHSPLLDSLCSRLEKAITAEVSTDRANCPVCEAELQAVIEEGAPISLRVVSG